MIHALEFEKRGIGLTQIFFTLEGTGQQNATSTLTQIGNGGFVKNAQFHNFLLGHIGKFFQAVDAVMNKSHSIVLRHVEFVHELFASNAVFFFLLLISFFSRHDVDLPAGEFTCQTHVLTTSANGNGKVFFVNRHVHAAGFFIGHNLGNLSGLESFDDVLHRIFIPTHNINAFAGEFIGQPSRANRECRCRYPRVRRACRGSSLRSWHGSRDHGL